MQGFLHGLDAGHYDTWLLLLIWFAVMAVVWPWDHPGGALVSGEGEMMEGTKTELNGFTFRVRDDFRGFGITSFPDRKKPALVILEPPNIIVYVAYFRDNEAANRFGELISELIPHVAVEA